MIMTKTENISKTISSIIKYENYNFDIRTIDRKNYDAIVIFPNGSNITLDKLVKMLNTQLTKDFKIALQHGDEGKDYLGYSFMESVSKGNINHLKFDGTLSEVEEGILTPSSLFDIWLMHGKTNDEIVTIKNRDENAKDLTGTRYISYIEIHVNKIGTTNKIILS